MWSRQGRIQLTIVAIEARVRTGPAPPSVSWQAASGSRAMTRGTSSLA